MTQRGVPLDMVIRGDLACFSRPEFAERISYPWITPSAARAVFEAVFWKPRIRYEIREIRVLREIVFTNFRRNEIGSKIPEKGLGPHSAHLCDRDRQQRNTVALKDVAYLVTAEMLLNEAIPANGPDDNHGKYSGCFKRRLAKGQCFHRPYLGMRELVADVAEPTGEERPIDESFQHGLMLYDFVYPKLGGGKKRRGGAGSPRPLLFQAHMEQGVIRVPPRERVIAEMPGAGA